MINGTIAAVVPMELPTMRRVNGIMATIRIMNTYTEAISDCLLRKGFFTGSARRRLSLPVVTGGGVIIGTIAALLGVGGSVMTVPLLRRHGYAMQECVSASNPLSLPVALCGAVTYAVIGWHSIPLSGFLGFISLKILGLLVLTIALALSQSVSLVS